MVNRVVRRAKKRVNTSSRKSKATVEGMRKVGRGKTKILRGSRKSDGS